MPSSADPGAVAPPGTRPPRIVCEGLGVRFRRGRKHSTRLRDALLRRGDGSQADDHFWPLRDVSFTVGHGEGLGVVGANGQGKSTLLKLVAGVLIPDEGFARVDGGVAPMIEVTGGFVGALTGRENVYLTAGLHGMPREEIDRRFDEIVDFAGQQVRDAIDTQFRHYSSGMRVRLGFSVITSLDEPVVLIDEVLAVGDRAFRAKCNQRMEELLGADRTVFLVSHSEAALKRFCNRGIYLRDGRLVADGPIDDVLEQYGEDVAQ
jgi:ABC-2 type transport system ATP-binding protein